METKKCTKCGEVKSLSAFYKQRKSKDGIHIYCKLCCDKYTSHWRKSNLKRVNARQSEYRKNNREKVNEHQKKYTKNNLEKERERKRRYYYDNSERMKENNIKWRKNNPEKFNMLCSKSFNKRSIILSDSFIANNILGLKISDCSPELIELKRAQLKLYRATKD